MEERYIILIAGAVASGKSRLSKYISKELGIICINKDKVKEILVDKLGYKNRDENKKLSETAFSLLLGFAEPAMALNKPIIIESNFRKDEEEILEKLIKKYSYVPLTLYLHSDSKILHKRYCEREKAGRRHIAHLSYESDDYDKFMLEIKDQIEFKIKGRRINIDTSDFSKINYKLILKKVKMFVKL